MAILSVLPAWSASPDPEAAIQSGLQFLAVHRDDVDFEAETAEKLAEPLRVAAEDSALAPGVRSRAHLVLAGIHGKLADQLRAKGGTAHGKLALKSLKEAVRLDPGNSDAAIAYATTITRMLSKGKVTRKFIEMGMGIKLYQEAQSAARAMSLAGLTAHPLYSELEEYLGVSD